MNLAVENWIDFISGGSIGMIVVAVIALAVVRKMSKWK